MTGPEVDDLAAPLDALLVDGAFGPLRRLAPDLSVAKVAGRLATRPGAAATRLRALAAELARVGLGTSELAPAAGDRRFTDPAWTGNPVLHRILQSYLAAGRTAEQLIADTDLGWRDDQRVRFLAENAVAALARLRPLLAAIPTQRTTVTGHFA